MGVGFVRDLDTVAFYFYHSITAALIDRIVTGTGNTPSTRRIFCFLPMSPCSDEVLYARYDTAKERDRAGSLRHLWANSSFSTRSCKKASGLPISSLREALHELCHPNSVSLPTHELALA